MTSFDAGGSGGNMAKCRCEGDEGELLIYSILLSSSLVFADSCTKGVEEPWVEGWLSADGRQPPVGLHIMVSVNSVVIIKSRRTVLSD